jgi:hypothetical protein
MRKKLILIDFLLIGLAVYLGYQFKARWVSCQAEHNLLLLKQKNELKDSTQRSPTQPLSVPNYAAVVDNHLFNVERNNIIPVDPPAPPSKVVGPKPILMGTVGLGGEEFALMLSADKNESRQYKRVKVGESLGGYTLVQILDQKVLMIADEKEVEVRLNEPSQLVARDLAPNVTAAPGPGNAEQVTTIGTEPTPPISSGSINPNPAAPPGGVPVGTIRDGRRKKLVPSPFGPMEAWEDIK